MQPATKTRRSRKSARTFQCTVATCGKVYSRAEHLSRHQLNHTPKEIYKCDVPNCCCSFVRADLYTLHRTRHMSEYLQENGNPKSQTTEHRGSIESLDYFDSVKDNSSKHSTYTPPQFVAHKKQMSDRDIEITSPQSSQDQPLNPFQMREGASRLSLQFDPGNQASNLPQQQEQFLDIEPWRNKVQAALTMPFFDGDSYARPPFAIPDDFIQFLFNENQFGNTVNDSSSHVGNFNNYAHTYNDFPNNQTRESSDPSYLAQLQTTAITPPYETSSPSRTLSGKKSQEISDFIRYRLIGREDGAGSGMRNILFEGDCSSDRHMLSREMMQQHIDNYWNNFHSHFPILHWPSFSPNETPNVLLISIMIIGASCSDKSGNLGMASSPVEFSNILAWYLRWEIFRSMHMESNSLWIYQALLLLELYEKTYSSRSLHERAHIHHATTITMMRRGSFLAGRSPLDTPPIYEEGQAGNENLNKNIADIWWQEWIRRESTRRVAFGGFMIDSMHAAMFGHSMIMVTHEMRLVLPCDDSLWSATSGSEVRRTEEALLSNGASPISFLEGLRRTLNGQDIHTNAFGRSILLCGVLSVSWHMNQRDIQISSLDIASHKGERGTKWRRSIARAFDLWTNSARNKSQAITASISKWPGNSDSVLGSTSTLYHLAQFSLNVDIVECQIFAGANRVLGRIIGAHEVDNVQRKIRKVWSPSVEARRATFYAIRFLCLVFRETMNGVKSCDHDSIINYATSTSILPVHRWVLYSSALVVWAYTYAVDGPSHVKTSNDSSIDDHIQEMNNFLKRAGNIKSPEDIAFYRLNGCTGMLQVLCYIFRAGTWDLLLEGADLLSNCIQLLENVEPTQ